ncbi:MAG: DEAD/DEAH box helicase [Bacteroidota bacterium]
MTFAELNLSTPLLNALSENGLEQPTPIQEKAFAVIMSGRDVVGIAQTGTGKTIAYLLPCLRQWKFTKDKFPQILILVPTRELVMQVVHEVDKLTSYLSTVTVAVYGGTGVKAQAEMVNDGMDIIVATPGRLLDLVLDGSLKLKAIKKLVIDEMDEMLNLGFRHQLNKILALLPAKRQNLLFSATLTEEVEFFIQDNFNDPVRIEAAPAGTPLENILQTGFRVPNFNTKLNLLQYLLEQDETMNKVLVFAATKKLADLLFEQLNTYLPEGVGVIHSNKDQNNRFNTIQHFKDGRYRVLIATDIIARGIDIAEVSHVINFDIPEEPEHYIHRIGRTGRADKKGISISLVGDAEIEKLEAIEKLMNYNVYMNVIPPEVEISTVLTADEIPVIFMPEVNVKALVREPGGPAFHEKSAKNKKTYVTRKDRAKHYVKPKKRSQKKRR